MCIRDSTNDDPNEAVFWSQGGNNFYLQNVFVSSNVTHIARHTNGNSILQNTHPDFAGSTDYSKIKTFAHQKLISNKFVLWDFGKFNRRTTDSLWIIFMSLAIGLLGLPLNTHGVSSTFKTCLSKSSCAVGL